MAPSFPVGLGVCAQNKNLLCRSLGVDFDLQNLNKIPGLTPHPSSPSYIILSNDELEHRCIVRM
jgi:hypothetical protein